MKQAETSPRSWPRSRRCRVATEQQLAHKVILTLPSSEAIGYRLSPPSRVAGKTLVLRITRDKRADRHAHP